MSAPEIDMAKQLRELIRPLRAQFGAIATYKALLLLGSCEYVECESDEALAAKLLEIALKQLLGSPPPSSRGPGVPDLTLVKT